MTLDLFDPAGTESKEEWLAPLMRGGGSVVNIGSLAGLTGHYPAAYTASKWALRGLTHAAAADRKSVV